MSQAYNTFGTPGNTVGNLNGLFKETYDSTLHLLIPDGVKLLNMIKFGSKEKMPGNLFHSPVILGFKSKMHKYVVVPLYFVQYLVTLQLLVQLKEQLKRSWMLLNF